MPPHRPRLIEGRFYLDGWALCFRTVYLPVPGEAEEYEPNGTVFAIAPTQKGKRAVVENGTLSKPVTVN